MVLAVASALNGWGQSPEYSLGLSFGQSRPVDRVLTRVDAADDAWVGERDYEEIDAELKELASALGTEAAGEGPLMDLVTAFSELELAEFKIVSTRRDPGALHEVAVSAHFELGGRARDGGFLSRQGLAEMTWVEVDGEWSIKAFVPLDAREERSDSRGFSEITEQVFGAIDSHSLQLSKGVDYWRDSLDAALGVSVYGHQGVSLGDFNGDGLEDLYVSQPGGLPNRLYRNDGDGTFSDVTRSAGVGVLDETSMSLFADVDNDGRQDLLLVGATPMLFRNLGEGRFRLDRESGLDVGGDRAAMLTGAAMADYDADGHLDLYVCAYDFWDAGSEYDAPTPYFDALNGPANLLFRNDGTGRFEEVGTTAGLGPTNNRFSFAAAWGDYDGDGDADLYVANDFGRNNLYRNNGDGTFTDRAAALGVEDLGAGMSAAWGDYDNDGDLDLYTANMWSSAGLRITGSAQFDSVAPSSDVRDLFRRQAQGNSLFRNDGPQGFTDVSDEAGVRRSRWAWASDFVDLNSDGLLDLFVQNGYITGERMDDL